jgi:predicted transposase YbfD/YdcC
VIAIDGKAITAIPELLEITGCIVTMDAVGTQTELAEAIVKGGGEYSLSVKENQRVISRSDV